MSVCVCACALLLTVVNVEWEGLQHVSIKFACSVAESCGNSVGNITQKTDEVVTHLMLSYGIHLHLRYSSFLQ